MDLRDPAACLNRTFSRAAEGELAFGSEERCRVYAEYQTNEKHNCELLPRKNRDLHPAILHCLTPLGGQFHI